MISSRYWELTWLVNPFRPSIRALDEGSVDVLVNASRSVRNTDIPGGDALVDINDTRFNTCQRVGVAAGDFLNYTTMIHEAGHALGLSNFSWRNPIGSSLAHPSIPDSVMNYDNEVYQITDEPDCSPHPIDIMAIRAL